MYRHGDVFLSPAESVPKQAKRLPHCVLAEGELTGHCHSIQEAGAAELFERGSERFLHVTAKSATLVHPEHNPIKLNRGIYRVWFQREYSPAETRRVID